MRLQLPSVRHRRAAVCEGSTPLVCSNVRSGATLTRRRTVSCGIAWAARNELPVQVVGRIVTASAAGKEKASTVDSTQTESEKAAALAAIEVSLRPSCPARSSNC